MPQIGAIVLAAGMSRRMGTAKLFLPLRGKPLFRYAVERAQANGLFPILLVGGEHCEKLLSLTSDIPQVEVLHNPDYAMGMASSLALGIGRLKGRAEAGMVFLADQPNVPDRVVQALMDGYRKHRPNGVRIVRPQYAGEAGHPVLFDASLFKELCRIAGDQGGKEVVARHRQSLLTIPFEQAEWGWDVDTREDYRRIREGTDFADR